MNKKIFYQDTYKVYLKRTERKYYEKKDDELFLIEEPIIVSDEKPLQIYDVDIINKVVRAHHLDQYPNEHIMVIALGACGHILGTTTLGVGTDSMVNSNIKGLFQFLFLTNAYGFVMAHNHPNSYMRASEQDILLTRQVNRIAKELDFELIDHIIINTLESNKGEYFSMKAEGLL